MAYNVIFTLTSAGSDTGPFNISGTTSGNVTTEIANNISKSTLLSGYEVTISDDTITGGTVASTGTCTNTQPWIKPTSTTPTPTSTPTPTASAAECMCYNFTNTTEGVLNITYTPCNDVEVTIGILALGEITDCVKVGTSIIQDGGIVVTLCGTPCTDELECSDCQGPE